MSTTGNVWNVALDMKITKGNSVFIVLCGGRSTAWKHASKQALAATIHLGRHTPRAVTTVASYHSHHMRGYGASRGWLGSGCRDPSSQLSATAAQRYTESMGGKRESCVHMEDNSTRIRTYRVQFSHATKIIYKSSAIIKLDHTQWKARRSSASTHDIPACLRIIIIIIIHDAWLRFLQMNVDVKFGCV